MAIEGIIRPPPDIRVVADRTAMFVAKNGRAFESRILGSAKGKTPKFAFLQPTSPFHAYYEDRIKHFESGGGDEDNDTKKKEQQQRQREGAAPAPKNETTEKEQPTQQQHQQQQQQTRDKVKKQKASIMDPVARAILGQRSVIANHLKKEREKRRKASEEAREAARGGGGEERQQDPGETQEKMLPLPAPPVPLDTVRVVAPYHVTPTQIETIQLVAQFVAMDGKGGPFLPALVGREWANPTFAFCQPRNVHFAYFSALVDAYRNIRSEWTAAAAAATTTGTAAAAAATIEPGSGAGNGAPPSSQGESGTAQTPPATAPVCDAGAVVSDAAYRTEYERELERRRQKFQKDNSNAALLEDGEIANAIDWHDFVVVETIDFPVGEEVDVGLSMLPTKTATTTATTVKAEAGNTTCQIIPGSAPAGASSAGNNDDMDTDESSSDEEDDNIRVVPSYTPKVVGTYDPSTARAVDPITGKSVAVADMTEHMRIQLLDPKWAEERKKFQDKQKDSNLVGGDAVVANIARLSQTTAAAMAPTTAGPIATSNPAAPRATVSAAGTPTVATAPPAGTNAYRRTGQQQQQHRQQHRQQNHSIAPAGFRRPPPGAGDAPTADQPPTKRLRTAPGIPPTQQHKTTVAPPLVTHNPPLPIGNTDGSAAPSNPAARAPTASNTPQSTGDASVGAAAAAPPAPAEDKKPLPPADESVVELQIRLPNDPSQQNWNFFGQTLTLEGVDARSTVKEVKALLSKSHLNGMPPNKIQLKSTDASGKFLNNNTSLAALNIGPKALLELKTKQRGGRK